MKSYIIKIQSIERKIAMPNIKQIPEQENYEKTKAALRLMCCLNEGKKSGEEKGWLSDDDVRTHFTA